jgi:hypothetical protein
MSVLVLPNVKEARAQSRIPVETLDGYRTIIKDAVTRAILDHKAAVTVELVNVAEAPRVLNRLIREIRFTAAKDDDGKAKSKTGYRAYVPFGGVVDGTTAGTSTVKLTIEWGKLDDMVLELSPPRPDFMMPEEEVDEADVPDEVED